MFQDSSTHKKKKNKLSVEDLLGLTKGETIEDELRRKALKARKNKTRSSSKSLLDDLLYGDKNAQLEKNKKKKTTKGINYIKFI